jgi:integration host factor subunit beta
MKRTELIAALARRFPVLTEQDAALSVKYLLDAITGAVAYGGRIEVRGFGSFGVRVCPLPKAHDPKTGEAVAVGTKCVPHFATGKALRQRVDHSSHP